MRNVVTIVALSPDLGSANCSLVRLEYGWNPSRTSYVNEIIGYMITMKSISAAQ